MTDTVGLSQIDRLGMKFMSPEDLAELFFNCYYLFLSRKVWSQGKLRLWTVNVVF